MKRIFVRIILTLFLFNIAGIFPGYCNETKEVLVLNSYHKGYIWSDEIVSELEALVRTHGNFNLNIEYLDSKKNPNKLASETAYFVLKNKYPDTKFLAVLACDDFATEFAIKNHQSLFPKVPVIFCGVNNPSLPKTEFSTGVFEKIFINEILHYALKFHPGVKNIYFLTDATLTGINMKKSIQEELNDKFKPISHFLSGEKLSTIDLKQRISRLSANDIILTMPWMLDKDGKRNNFLDLSKELFEKSKSPIYSFSVIKDYVIGGILPPAKTQGKIAYKILEQINNGKQVSDIPLKTPEISGWFFNNSQLKKWRIPISALPENSNIYNRSNFFDKHKMEITLLTALFFIQLSAILLLLIERKKRIKFENDLIKSENEKHLILTNIEESIAFLDKDLNVLWTNKHSKSDTKNLSKNVSTESCYLSIIENHTPCEDCSVLKSIRSKKTEIAELKTPDGRVLRKTAIPVFNEKGDFAGIIESNLDITIQKNAERKYVQVQKLDAIGQLAAGLAHDFNNILQAMTGYLELLKDSNLGEIEKDYLKLSLEAGEMGKELIKQLLTFSKKDKSTEITPIDVNSICNNFKKLLTRVIPSNINLSLSLLPSPIIVSGSKSKLEQILMNLCINARDAMPEGGNISISTEIKNIEQTWQTISGRLPPGLYCMIRITDNGEGISDKNMERIFEPFFTTKPQGKGTGLGLASVFGIVKELGGSIEVNSKPGEGTSFKLFLPLLTLNDHASVEANCAENAINIKGNDELILVAEDNDLVRNLLKSLLTKSGYRVISFSDGQSALDFLQSDQEKPALLLLDIVMPRLMGTAVAKIAKEDFPEIPILFCSGYSKDQLSEKPDGPIVLKPFSKKDLITSVKNLLG